MKILEKIKDYDEDTYEHCIRVSEIAKEISEPFDVDHKTLIQAAIWHDIGKIYIPSSIINKPGKLTQKERMTIDYHSYYGYLALKKAGADPKVCDLVLFHHGMEKVPKKYHIKKEGIEREIALLRAADIYDALTSDRPYRKAFSKNHALKIMQEESVHENILKEFDSI